MARSVLEITQDIDGLRKAIGSGASRVEFGSGATRHVTEFRTMAGMREALASLEAELAALTAPTSAPSRTAYIEHGRD